MRVKNLYCAECKLNFHNQIVTYACHKDIVHGITRSFKLDPNSQKFTCVFECKHCVMVFDRKQKLINHNKCFHVNLKLHKCHICRKSFIIKHLLNNHMINIHKKQVCCDYCPRKYVTKDKYKMHLLTYHRDTMEKLFDTKINIRKIKFDNNLV